MSVSFRVRYQEKKAAALQASYEDWKAEHQGAMMALEMKDSLAECKELADEILDEWQTTWTEIRENRHALNLERVGKTFLGLFERLERFLQRVRADALTVESQTGQRIEGIGELERNLERIGRLHQQIKTGWPWTGRPWPQLNRAMQAESRASEGEEVTSILARLEAGSPLVAE